MIQSPDNAYRKLFFTGLVLLFLSSVALLFPPPALPAHPPALEATLLERLFPGVPGWWVVGRLFCLLFGAMLTCIGFREAHLSMPHWRAGRGDAPADIGRPLLLGMLLFSATLAVLSLFVERLDRPAQLVYLACLSLPTLAARFGVPRQMPNGFAGSDWKDAWAIPLIAAVWLAIRAVCEWQSPWIATPVDSFTAMRTLQSLSLPDRNVLTHAVMPGFRGTLLVLQGGGWLEKPMALPRLETLLMFNTGWSVVTALLLGWLVRRSFDRGAACIAVATFLFAPLVTVSTLFAPPLFLGPLLSVLLLVLLWKVHADRSVAALLALGPLAGLATTHPSFVPILLFTGVLTAFTLSHRPRYPISLVAVSALLFLAAAVPRLPSWNELEALRGVYSGGVNMWAGIETVFFGQVDPRLMNFFAGLGHPGSFDILLGALLTPFATARTALRLWGDAVFDPVGGALAAIGIAACLRTLLVSRVAGLMLLLLAAAVLPGFLSSYDRVSLLRVVALPVSVSLLAAVGFRRIRGAFDRRSSGAITVVLAAAIMAAGTYLWENVNPRILAQSAMTLSLRAAANANDRKLVFLTFPEASDPQRATLFVPELSNGSIEVIAIPFEGDGIDDELTQLNHAILFWSPGQEEASGISDTVCDLFPSAALYTLVDDAGLSRSFAADTSGDGWQPAIPPGRWMRQHCGDPLDTEGHRGRVAVKAARSALEAGDRDGAIRVLRALGDTTFAQADAYALLSRLLAEQASSREQQREGIDWMRRANEASLYLKAPLVAELAALYARDGQYFSAEKAAQRAAIVARADGDLPFASELEQLARDYGAKARPGSP